MKMADGEADLWIPPQHRGLPQKTENKVRQGEIIYENSTCYLVEFFELMVYCNEIRNSM